jgi:hypothetical protein
MLVGEGLQEGKTRWRRQREIETEIGRRGTQLSICSKEGNYEDPGREIGRPKRAGPTEGRRTGEESPELKMRIGAPHQRRSGIGRRLCRRSGLADERQLGGRGKEEEEGKKQDNYPAR